MWDQVSQVLNRATVRVVSEVVNLLPGIVALIMALVISAIVGGILAFTLRRSLRSIDFDERLRRWGWFPGTVDTRMFRSPTLVASRVVFWGIVLIGFLIGIAAFDAALTSQFVSSLLAYLPNVIAAVLVLLVGNLIAQFLARSVLIGAVNMNLQYARLLSQGVKWLVLVLTVAMALEHLSIGGDIVRMAFGILFGGIVLALALAVGLGSKELVSRSLEKESSRTPTEVEEPFRHL